MPTLITRDPKPIWGELDWNGTKTADLRRQVKVQLKRSNISINEIFKKIIMVDVGVPKVEDFTLYDIAINARLHASKQNAAHWMAVMAMLRSLGAKPACAIIGQMSKEEKAKNEQISVRLMQHYWQQKKRPLNSIIQR